MVEARDIFIALVTLVLTNLGGLGLIWYKLGTLETRLREHFRHHEYLEDHRHDDRPRDRR